MTCNVFVGTLNLAQSISVPVFGTLPLQASENDRLYSVVQMPSEMNLCSVYFSCVLLRLMPRLTDLPIAMPTQCDVGLH